MCLKCIVWMTASCVLCCHIFQLSHLSKNGLLFCAQKLVMLVRSQVKATFTPESGASSFNQCTDAIWVAEVLRCNLGTGIRPNKAGSLITKLWAQDDFSDSISGEKKKFKCALLCWTFIHFLNVLLASGRVAHLISVKRDASDTN